MDIALTEQLTKSFPQLYKPNFQFECNDGWFNLIYDLSEKISQVIKEKYPTQESQDDFAVTVSQSRSKSH